MQAIRVWALVALVLLGGACLRTAPPGVHGLPLPREPLPEGIVLVDHHGRPFALDALRGRVTVLAFGYTFCPDVCLATLATLKRARGLLKSEGAQVRVLFITTDPVRDTPERLRWYVSLFHPEFVGLTGTQQSLARLYQTFDVYPTRYTSAGDGGLSRRPLDGDLPDRPTGLRPVLVFLGRALRGSGRGRPSSPESALEGGV